MDTSRDSGVEKSEMSERTSPPAGAGVVPAVYRTQRCGELTAAHVGQEVTLCGWVRRSRDQGGLIFIDLWDRAGIVQTIFDGSVQPEAHRVAAEARSEFVMRLRGRVHARPEGSVNPKLPTGEIEVHVEEAEILNGAKTPPFPIVDRAPVDESLRLTYRYLDL